MDEVALNLNIETVDQAMTSDVLVVSPDLSVREAIDLMNEHKTGSLLICDADGVLMGIFTERDVLAMIASGADLGVRIENRMTPRPRTLRLNQTVGAAVRSMARGGYRRLPIVDDAGRPTGIIKTSGIVHYLVQHFPNTVYNLPPETTAVQQREGA